MFTKLLCLAVVLSTVCARAHYYAGQFPQYMALDEPSASSEGGAFGVMMFIALLGFYLFMAARDGHRRFQRRRPVRYGTFYRRYFRAKRALSYAHRGDGFRAGPQAREC